MKKRLFVSLALALAVMFGYAMQAEACHLISADIDAECIEAGVGYQITYTITAYTDSGSLVGEYSLLVDGGDVTPSDNTITATQGGGIASGSVDVDCGDYTIQGSVLAGGVTKYFGPINVTCPCEPPPQCQSDLIAGQNWDSPAGVVTVWVKDTNGGTNLHVKFETIDGWNLGDTHLYVGTDPPTKSAPGKFPYKAVTEYIIPLSDFGAGCGDTLYIAAHAVVSQDGQQETAWADTYGISFGRGWAMYFQYEVCNGCIEP